MKVVIPTVQHTGTLFLRGMFADIGFEELTFDQEPKTKRCVYCDHLIQENMDRVHKLMRKHPAVIPMRHPWLVMLAWEKRGKPLEELKQQVCFLNQVKRKYHPLCLPIDTDERDIYLSSVRLALGVPLKTKWKPTNSRTKTYKVDPELLDPLIPDEHKDFFRASVFSIYYDL